MNFDQLAESWQVFQHGYAGQHTHELETRSRDLAGRQDDFCILCLRRMDDEDLFPQMNSNEVHFCPRRFCEDCCKPDDNWHLWSDRFEDSVYERMGDFVAQTCLLCWKRSWGEVSPILGSTNPAWQYISQACQEMVQIIRMRDWLKDLNGKFEWRRELISCHDDMSLDSDRRLLLDIRRVLQSRGYDTYITSNGFKMLTRAATLYNHDEGTVGNGFDTLACFQVNFRVAHDAAIQEANHTGCISLSDQTKDDGATIVHTRSISRNDTFTNNELERPLAVTSTSTDQPHLNGPAPDNVGYIHPRHSQSVSTEITSRITMADHDMVSLESNEEEDGDANRAQEPHRIIRLSRESSLIEPIEDIPYRHPDTSQNAANEQRDSTNLLCKKLHRSTQHLLDWTNHAGLSQVDPAHQSSDTNSNMADLCVGVMASIEPNVSTDCTKLSPMQSTNMSSIFSCRKDRMSTVLPSTPMSVESGGLKLPLEQTSIPETSFDAIAKTFEDIRHFEFDILNKLNLDKVEMDRLRDENKILQDEIDRLKQNLFVLNRIQIRKNDVDVENQALRKEKHSLQGVTRKLRRKIADQCKDHELKSVQHEKHIQTLTAEQESTKAAYEKLKEDHQQTQEALNASEAYGTDLRTRLSQLELRVAEHEKTDVKTRESLASLHTERDELVNQVSALEILNEAIEMDCKTLLQQIETQENALATHQRRFRAMTKRQQDDLDTLLSDKVQLEDDMAGLLIEYLNCRREPVFNANMLYIKLLTGELSHEALRRIGRYPAVIRRLSQYERLRR